MALLTLAVLPQPLVVSDLAHGGSGSRAPVLRKHSTAPEGGHAEQRALTETRHSHTQVT